MSAETYLRKPIEALHSVRLNLVPIELSDAPNIQRLFNDFETLRFMSTFIPWPYPDDGASKFLATIVPKLDRQEEYYWAIRLRDQPRLGLIGAIGLTPCSEDDHRGFWLGREFWGRGYMREAVDLVTEFAFEHLQMQYLLLNNAEPNLASHRLKESAGAEIIGIDPEFDFIGGKFPRVRWKLNRDIWRENRNRSS